MEKDQMAQEIVDRKENLERDILRAFGQKVKFEVTTDTYRDSRLAVEFEAKDILTGTEIGILGRAIFTVDFTVRLSRNLGVDADWTGSIDLRWYHPEGGTNGFQIGYIAFDREQYDSAAIGKLRKGAFVITKRG